MPATVRQPTPVATATAARPAAAAGTRQGAALLVALLVAWVFAAFSDGATAAPAETRLQVALAALALAALVGVVASGGLRFRAPRAALVGVGCLVAFAGWSALTLAWSVAPDSTWISFNRAVAYALVAALAVCVGASAERPVERFALGYLAATMVICLYAFGGKAMPGVHVSGLFDLDHTDQVSRLRAPLGYWNALALVLVLAIPIALRIAVDRARGDRLRLAALLGIFLLIATTAMTYSRGGVLALTTAVAVTILLGTDRLRSILALTLAGLAAIPVIAIDFGRDSLTENGAPLRERIADGRSVTAMAFVMGATLLAAGWWLLKAEHQGSWTAGRSRTIGRGLALLAAFYLFASVGGAAQQPGGLGEQISKSWHAFSDIRQDRQYDPVRLASTNSGNRWVWWKEAVGSWSDRPLGGWGAGSFPVVHLRYRENTIPVAQPHSVPLQFLSETGLIGLLLAGGGLGLLGFAAVRRVRAAPPGRERDLGVALLAGAAAWVVHGAYDWDWDIPGVTIPVVIFLGLLAALPASTPDEPKPGALFTDPDRIAHGNALRALALGGATLVACVIAASAILPDLASSKAESAQEHASAENVTPAQLRSAAAEADVAARLDPLSPDPLFAAYAIALQRGRPTEARRLLLDAADRDPNDTRVWTRLAALAFQLADRTGYQQASLRALELDPRNPGLRRAASRAVAFIAPPNASATATGTPLPVTP